MEDRYSEMHRENQDTMAALQHEIKDLKQKLVRTGRDKTKSVDSTAENIKRISDVLCRISDKKTDITNSSYSPILDLLEVGPLRRTEIHVPLNVLKQLISVGFGVNDAFEVYPYKTCLYIAVENHHYNAARLLIQHGAKSSSSFLIPPINLLALQPDAPLDLFALLATPQNLNDLRQVSLPLHKAVSCGHTTIALHLIKLGARVDQKCRDGLPIECYFQGSNKNRFNSDNKLFMSLLPPRMHGTDVLRVIFLILSSNEYKNYPHLLEMTHQLLQRLHFDKPLVVEINAIRRILIINDIEVASFSNISLLPIVYLYGWILVELQFDLVLTPSEIEDILKRRQETETTHESMSYARAVDDMWKKYR